MSIQFAEVKTAADQKKLADLADEIWHEYWPDIIGSAQTDYMVKQFQSQSAIARDIAEQGYEYWFMIDDTGTICGYTGGHDEDETQRYFISKIYVKKEYRGKGFCSATIRFYDTLCQARGHKAMYLTVNKHNALGLRAYTAKGFQTIESVQNPIGEGFVMDDYVMERTVEHV